MGRRGITCHHADRGYHWIRAEYLLGSVQIGESAYWVGDYTIQSENGGVGVFVHEYTHDLGIPDLYDTYAGENSTGFWTLMSSGSWLSEVDYDLGSAPGHLGPWEKLMLGWLDYAEAPAGATTGLTLGPVEFSSTKPASVAGEPAGQGAVVDDRGAVRR